MADLNEVEKRILIDASEDYTPLGEAAFEAPSDGGTSAKAAVLTLLREGYVRLYEIEQINGLSEVQRFDLDAALRIVENDEAWTPPLELGERYYALFATDKGEHEFKRLIGAA